MGEKKDIVLGLCIILVSVLLVGTIFSGTLWASFSEYSIEDSLNCISDKNNTEILYLENWANEKSHQP